MDELRNDASYENAQIYKDKTKRWHDKHMVKKRICGRPKSVAFQF